jgi:hypothetical protein
MALHTFGTRNWRLFIFSKPSSFSTETKKNSSKQSGISTYGLLRWCNIKILNYTVHISHKIYIFSLKSVGLVRWSPLLTLNPESPGLNPKQARKEEQKIKVLSVLSGDQKSAFFHGFNPESTTETSNRNFVRNFEWPKLRALQKTYEIPPEVSVERKFLKIQAKINYCVIQNFGFPLPKHSGRQLLQKFQVQKFYPKLWIFEQKIRVFQPKLRVFEPKLRVFEPKLRVFRTETLGFFNRNFRFSNRNFVFFKTEFSC